MAGSAPLHGTAVVARPAPPERPRVLLAEGDVITARAVRHRLERDRVDVVGVEDGPGALEALRTEPFGALVVDAALAGIDGLDLLRRVRAGDAGPPDLPVVVLAWPGNDAAVARAYDLDADGVLVRPLSLVALSASVRRLLRRSR